MIDSIMAWIKKLMVKNDDKSPVASVAGTEKAAGAEKDSEAEEKYPLPEKHPESGYKGIDCSTESFSGMAKRCAMREADAMLWMSKELRRHLSGEFNDLLAFRIAPDDDNEFAWLITYLNSHDEDRMYFLGANMWLARAAHFGSEKAKDTLMSVPEYRFSLFPNDFFTGNGGRAVQYHGKILREIGLLDFIEDEDYLIMPLNQDNIYVASFYVDYDGPDESGFGMENYYNYYYFDEYFCLLFMLKKWSRSDVRDDPRIPKAYKKRRKEKQDERNAWLEKMNQCHLVNT